MRKHALAAHQMVVMGLLIMAPFLGSKVAKVGGLTFVASLVCVALVYALLDVINEVWGKAQAVATISIAVLARIGLMLTMAPLAVALPTLHAPEGYTEVLEATARVFIAGEIAVWLGNVIFDIPVFTWLKAKRVRGGFFVRTNLSNLLSSVVSAALFGVIAFAGTLPVWPIIKGQVIVRVALLLLISPFTTLWTRWLLRGEPND